MLVVELREIDERLVSKASVRKREVLEIRQGLMTHIRKKVGA